MGITVHSGLYLSNTTEIYYQYVTSFHSVRFSTLAKSRVLRFTPEISERNHFMLELYAKAWCYFEKLPISKFSFLNCSHCYSSLCAICSLLRNVATLNFLFHAYKTSWASMLLSGYFCRMSKYWLWGYPLLVY